MTENYFQIKAGQILQQKAILVQFTNPMATLSISFFLAFPQRPEMQPRSLSLVVSAALILQRHLQRVPRKTTRPTPQTLWNLRLGSRCGLGKCQDQGPPFDTTLDPSSQSTRVLVFITTSLFRHTPTAGQVLCMSKTHRDGGWHSPPRIPTVRPAQDVISPTQIAKSELHR